MCKRVPGLEHNSTQYFAHTSHWGIAYLPAFEQKLVKVLVLVLSRPGSGEKQTILHEGKTNTSYDLTIRLTHTTGCPGDHLFSNLALQPS